ncbi:MAG TPA: hypothetical protein VII87_06260 [Solirubrobacteraceae bacterium]|jgi:hypothetical protein
MNAEAQLSYEARVRNRQAIVALLAGVLLVVASAVQLGGPHTKVDELTVDLIVANKRFPLDLIASTLNGLGSLAVAWTLTYLYKCSAARSPDVRAYVKWIAIAGGVLAAVTGVVYAIIVATKVHEFVTTGAQTYDEANRLTGSSGLIILQVVGQAAALLLAIGVVLVALNAMRQGLLSRFMGYLGIFAGVLVLFQITQIPIVQGYWLAALGYLFSGRWPTGLPPAWTSGRAEPWPPSSMRGQSMTQRSPRRGSPEPIPAPAPAGAPLPARTRSGTPKRKRKRRN